MSNLITRARLLVITLLGLALFPAAGSQATVMGSKHDLSFLTGGGNFQSDNETEICIFCHTPHGAIVSDWNGNSVPLWNRNGVDVAPTFSLYNSDTFNAGPSGLNTQTQPTGESLLCLSCHDGVSTLNTLVNYGTVNPITMMSNYTKIEDVWIGPGNPPGYPGANIGESGAKDLSNDHPISFVFNNALITADAAGGPAKLQLPTAPLKLFGPDPVNNGRLECATCHDPHEEGLLADGTYPFLRMSNWSSDMCFKCHIK